MIEIDGFKRSDIEGLRRLLRQAGPADQGLPGLLATRSRWRRRRNHPRSRSDHGGRSAACRDRRLRRARQRGRDHADGRPRPRKPEEAGGDLDRWAPANRPSGDSFSYRRALGNLFAVAAGAGISVAVAAGDNGSAECSREGEFIDPAAAHGQRSGQPRVGDRRWRNEPRT